MADPTSAFDLSALPAWARRLRLRDLDEDASCERTPVCFTFDEAAALVDGLCATAQYQPHQDVRSYLVDLFCTLPHAGGEALDVVEARQDAIVEALERDTANAASRLAADHAGVLICVASERARHPGWGAWVDIPALLALQRRLGTGDRTDADKEYGRLLDRVLTAGCCAQSRIPCRTRPCWALKNASRTSRDRSVSWPSNRHSLPWRAGQCTCRRSC